MKDFKTKNGFFTGNVGVGTTNPESVLQVQGSQAYAASASDLATSVTKSALRVRGSNNSSDSLWMGVENVNANPYIQGSNGDGSNAKNISINPFGGNVGIGTTNPRGKLEIGESSEDAFYVDFQSGEGITNFKSPYSGVNGNRGGWQFITKDGGTTPYNALRINSVGNVGIGTASPNTSLHVTTSSGNGDGVVFIQNTLADYGMGLKVKGGGNADNQRFALKVQNANGDDILFAQSRTGNVGIGTANPTSRFQVEEPVSANQTTALFVRNQSSHTSLGGATIAGFHNASDYVMQIKTNGNVGIGTTNPSAGRLDVWQTESASDSCIKTVRPGSAERTHLAFYTANGLVGTIKTSGNTTSYNTSSDYRLKENVIEVDNAIERVNNLKPCRFNFIADPGKIVDGFLAHEVQEVVPEAISGEKDAVKEEEYEITPAELDDDGNVITEAEMGTRQVPDYQGIDQGKLVPLLTKAIQEQQAMIEDLKKEIEQLKS